MNGLRVAIVGCGNIARKHVASLIELGETAAVTAICDSNPERLAAFAADVCRPHYPDVLLYASVDDLLAQDDADLVTIATGSDSHASLALQALRAGKHVLAEKPLALSMKEAREAAAEAKRRGLVLAVSFQARYLAQMKAVREAVRQNRFGAIGHGVVSLRWHRPPSYYSESPWRDAWSKGGGLFMNQCIHYIDLLLWLLGPVDSVYAQAAAAGDSSRVDNTGAVVLRFRSGAIGMIEASTAVRPGHSVTSLGLFGEKGSAVFGGAMLNEPLLWSFESPDPDSEEAAALPAAPADRGVSHTPLYRDLAHAVRTGSQPLVAAHDTLDAHETVLAIYRSISSGASVKLPLADFDMGKMAWME